MRVGLVVRRMPSFRAGSTNEGAVVRHATALRTAGPKALHRDRIPSVKRAVAQRVIPMVDNRDTKAFGDVRAA